MPLVSLKEMLDKALMQKYAVGAFNVENMEMAQAVIAAAAELNSPVILQTTQSTLKYAAPKVFANIVSALTEEVDIPVAIHLDHSQSIELIRTAIKSGYTSVMFDGSELEYRENKTLTIQACEYAHSLGVSVEAELGSIGGKEDDIVNNNNYTNLFVVSDFVQATGIDLLAIAIGTAHGFYKKTPALNLELLSDIRKRVDVPLVLHGGSGLSDEVVMETIVRGISKINFATELRAAFTEGVREYLGSDSIVFDPKKYLAASRQRVKDLVKKKILVCGSNDKAF